MVKMVFAAVLVLLLALVIKGIRDYGRNRDKIEELEEAKQKSEELDIEEQIAKEKRYQRDKRADIDDINLDK